MTYELSIKGESLNELAPILAAINGTASAAPVKIEKTEKVEKPEKAKAEPAPAAPAAQVEENESPEKVTIEMIREVIAPLSSATGGKKEQVKALLQTFGVSRATDLQQEQYADFLAKAKKL